MSRLIRNDKSKNTNENSQNPSEPLTKDSIVTHLKKCQAIASQAAQQAFKGYMRDLDEAFNVEMDSAKSNQDVTELTGIQRQFSRNRGELERY